MSFNARLAATVAARGLLCVGLDPIYGELPEPLQGDDVEGALVAANDVAGAQASPISNFYVAGNAGDRGGVRLAATDADGDARADVAAGSGEGSPSKVRVYLGANFSGASEPGTFQFVGRASD